MQKTYPQVDIKLYTIAGIVQKTEVVKESTFFPKLKMGDEIISINNYILNGMEINSAIDMIRGTGTYLLKIRLKRNNKILEYTVPRGSTAEIKMSSDVLSGDIVKITASSPCSLHCSYIMSILAYLYCHLLCFQILRKR